MKLDVNKRLCFALGFALASPFYVQVGGAPVFFVQAVIIAALLIAYVLRHKTRSFSLLDQVVTLYVGWSIASFLLYVPILWLTGHSELALSQFVSLMTMFLLISPYVIARQWEPERQFGFERGIIVGLAALTFGLVMFYVFNFRDLWAARAVIEQRIPMMITFLCWAVGSLAFWGHPRKNLLILIWASCSILVLITLTRACYIQWAISGALFLFFRGTSVFSRKLLLGLAPACLVVVAMLAASASAERDTGVIISRFDQLLTINETVSTDESAMVRLEIWRRLGERFKESPMHLLIGYGQLGPSYASQEFVSPAGAFVMVYNAHSQYLDTVFRTGLIGLCLELAIFAIVVIRPFRSRSNGIPGEFFKAHSVALAGILLYGIFHETFRWQMFGFYFWTYAGLLSGALYQQPVAKPLLHRAKFGSFAGAA